MPVKLGRPPKVADPTIHQFQVRLPRAVYLRLVKLAKAEHRSMNQQIIVALLAYQHAPSPPHAPPPTPAPPA